MKKNSHTPLYLMFGLTGIAVLSLGAYTVTTLSAQQETLLDVSTALQSMANNQAAAPGDLDASIERTLEQMKARERQAQRDQLYSQYSNASQDWEGESWLYGNPDARFTLVEYADTECSYCKRFHSTPKGIVDSSNGNVNWEYQHMNIFGEQSLKQAQAAECVGEQLGNQAFWVYLSEIYERTQSSGQGAGDLRAIADEVGANLVDFDSCVSSGSYLPELEAATASARSMGITGTPATVLVDNQTGESQLLGGAQPTEAFVQVMRQMMQRDS